MQWGKLNFGSKRQGDSKPSDYGGILYDTILATSTWLREYISVLICIVLPETTSYSVYLVPQILDI
jgi:hypothetical protein